MKVLITGGANGLGAAMAKACAQRGDTVHVIDVAAPAGPLWHQHDMGSSDDTAWDRLREWMTRHGPFDLVILSAGISATGRFETIALRDHHTVTAINLTGPIRLAHLLEQGAMLCPGGRLILVASLSCFTGYPGASSYAASKDGLAAFARALRSPLRKRGVAVQLVCPGPMDTAHAARYAPPGASNKGRIAPDRVARAILAAPAWHFVIIPGAGPKLAALLGRFMPQTMTRLMGRFLFSRLR